MLSIKSMTAVLRVVDGWHAYGHLLAVVIRTAERMRRFFTFLNKESCSYDESSQKRESMCPTLKQAATEQVDFAIQKNLPQNKRAIVAQTGSMFDHL